MSDRFVVLLRHGIAFPHGSMPEEKRGLTDEGKEEMKAIARALAKIVPDVEAIYSSPLLRAQQTAAFVANPLKLDVQTADELRSGAQPEELQDLLNRVEGRLIICVGHEPTLSEMMLELTGIRGDLELKKAGCYGVRIASGRGALQWILTPKILRAAARE